MNTQNLNNLMQEQISTNVESSSKGETNIAFWDFSCFAQLEKQPAILEGLIKCYQGIFSEPDIWNEYYSEQEINMKLQLELSGHCSIRVCIDVQREQVVGFCWAQSLGIEQIGLCIESVKYVEGAVFQGVKKCLGQRLTGKTAVYLHDLGVDKNYRHTISLESLIVFPIASVAKASGDQQLVFWSVAQTCIAQIAKKVGIAPFYQQDNLLFFCGSLAG